MNIRALRYLRVTSARNLTFQGLSKLAVIVKTYFFSVNSWVVFLKLKAKILDQCDRFFENVSNFLQEVPIKSARIFFQKGS